MTRFSFYNLISEKPAFTAAVVSMLFVIISIILHVSVIIIVALISILVLDLVIKKNKNYSLRTMQIPSKARVQ